MVRARFHALAVADIRRETPGCVSLAFAVPSALRERFRFKPGQYLTLRATLGGVEVRRCYSICSGLDDGELRVAVKHVPGGLFSTFANEALRHGDTVEAMPPEGRFTTALAPGTYAALACGSGITPILSLVTSLLARDKGARIFLLYGNRTGRDIIFAEALARLKDRYIDRFSVTHVLSREAQDVPALNGRLDREHISRLLPAGPIDRAFLCGPEAMMDEAGATLAERGLAPAQILREHFRVDGEGPRPAPPPSPVPAAAATIAEIVIDGRRHEIAVPDGVSIIEAARAAGLDLPYSCQGGMCCTCRARLAGGRAEMAVNYSLQQWEIDAGFILTCQARPLTPRLTLDFDAA